MGCSESGKINVLLNLIKRERPNVDEMFCYVKNLFESKYQLFMNGKEKVRVKNKGKSKDIDYSQTIDEVYENFWKEKVFDSVWC